MAKRTGKIKLICGWCNTEYLVYPSVIEKQKRMGVKAHFCSRKCKYKWNKTQPGYWKDKKMPTSAKDNMSRNHADVSGSKNPRWVGGRRLDKDGYIIIYCPDHPYRSCDNYVREHRLVMEQFLKRFLHPTEVVHHINGIKNDNCIDNLMLFESCSEHRRFHEEQKRNTKNS